MAMDNPKGNQNPLHISQRITIKGLQIRTQGKRSIGLANRYFVRLSIGDLRRSTKKAEAKKNDASWNETFFFDGNENCELEVEVYQNHRFGQDKLVGSLKDTIGALLGKARDGVLEESLSKSTSSGTVASGIILKFVLATETLGNVNAEERQAEDAVSKMNQAVSALGSSPGVVDPASSAMNTASNITTQVQNFENTWGFLLERIKLFDEIVTGIAEIHPYASLAWSVLSAANKVLVNQQARDDRIIRLAGTMNDMFTFVHDADPLKTIEAHRKTIVVLIQQVTECGYFIAEYAKQKSFWIRMTKYTLTDIDSRITEYETKFKELKTAFLEGITVYSGVTVFRMMNTVQNIAESIDLNDMPYAFGARYMQEKGCLPGTREYFIRDICDILNDVSDDAPRVCLLIGVAGSGKSAVAHTIARLYDEQRRLGSSYCFARADLAARNAKNFFSTIARDLSDHDPQFKSELWRVVKDNRALRTSISPLEQIQQLIVQPSKRIDAIGPLLVVVDALDESGDPSDRRQLLEALYKQIKEHSFPTNIRFLITARPERDIITILPPSSQIVHVQLGDVSESLVDEDLEKFIHYSLAQLPELDEHWPNKQWCQLLVHQSQHLFQWASTACKFIRSDDSAGFESWERLETLLQTNRRDPLDELYQTILGQLFPDDARPRFREVMAIILALKEPQSLATLSALFGKTLNFRVIIKPLGSLLEGAVDEQRPIRPLHTSFRDFLLDDQRSSSFYVPILPHHHLSLGSSLVSCMRNMLKFNICNLKDSRFRNAVIPDLPSHIKAAIPMPLVYSCQYWMNHLQHAECTPELLHDVTTFFKTCFPYWLEVISLLTSFSPTLYILSALETCTLLQKWTKGSEIATLASEASHFIQVFSPLFRDSTPHLYLSAMPQTPSSSLLSTLWVDHLQNHISVTLGHPTNWPAQVLILQGHKAGVRCVAYSPDGTHVVSSSDDNTLRVWDVNSGQCIAGPLQGHTDMVHSVVYSPDGSHIVSGSFDKTIRMWNATTGQCIPTVMLGHTDFISCVAYSPDGSYIASGSRDKSIRIWDPSTGQCVRGPFEGHEGWVYSIAYSPDGSHIVSGSLDCTIRLWDVNTGQCVGGPLEGHTDPVVSVAYSPDGGQFVSGSRDSTIIIWDAATGECVVGPLKGHASQVFSVAYSPDGHYIVSGSLDCTIRIWDATTGQCIAGPFQEHSNAVSSAAYSPDGTHIVSGSGDSTIRIWNARIGHGVANPSQGHTNWIYSVAFSPDGAHIVSGSYDKTIRIWDVTTGECVAGPLEGHTDFVYCVAYSPDGRHIVSGAWDNTIRIWDISSGQCVGGPWEGHTDHIYSVAYAPDGRHVVSGSRDNTLRIWDATTGQCVAGPFQEHSDAVHSTVYSPDGNHIASGSWDTTIRIWDAATGQCVAGPLQGHAAGIRIISYSPDGSQIASGSVDKTVRVWDATSGQCIAGPFMGHTDEIYSVTYSPDGCSIFSGSQDTTIRSWDLKTGKSKMAVFQGHTDMSLSIAHSPNGSCIVSASADQTIKVWSLAEDLEDWQQKADGWIQTPDGACICWIPSWARHAFYLPRHCQIMSSHQSYKLDLSASVSGESWMLCWK